jgi:pyruvate ferredoxin oxidoreductase alpha subunit
MLVSARAFNSPNLSIWNGWEFPLIDMGWNAIFSENVQETYDASIIACRVSEDTLFPTMFIHDGFITSHSAQKYWVMPNEDVMKFAPKNPRHHISPQKPGTWGSIVYPTYFTEGRLNLERAKEGVLAKMDEVFKEFESLTGRSYQHIETFNLDGGAKTVFLTMGSMCGNIITWMQKTGRKDVGLIKLRTWRPFPKDQLRKIIQENGIEKIIVLEKDDDLSNILPPVGKSVAAALSGLPFILRSFICGLGGRDVTKNEIELAAQKMESLNDMNGKLYDYLGARETKNTLHEMF